MPTLERHLLQAAIALAGLVPVCAGLGGGLYGAALMGDTLPPVADNHYRYLSGLLLAIGLASWSIVPSIERHGPTLRLLAAIVATGGLLRLGHAVAAPVASPVIVAALVMELCVTPALYLWQRRIAARA